MTDRDDEPGRYEENKQPGIKDAQVHPAYRGRDRRQGPGSYADNIYLEN